MSLSHKFEERCTVSTVACTHGGASDPTPAGVAATRRHLGHTPTHSHGPGEPSLICVLA